MSSRAIDARRLRLDVLVGVLRAFGALCRAGRAHRTGRALCCMYGANMHKSLQNLNGRIVLPCAHAPAQALEADEPLLGLA